MINFNIDIYFTVFANCIPVNGISRSIIYDLQKNNYYFIPNDMYEIIILTKTMKLSGIYKKFGDKNKEYLDDYFLFLKENELGFFNDEVNSFPELEKKWESPSIITNCILDINTFSVRDLNYKRIIEDLSSLNCRSVQLRFFSFISIELFMQIISYFNNTRVREIRIIVGRNLKLFLNDDVLKNVLFENSRIKEIIFYKSSVNSINYIHDVRIIDIKKILTKESCGEIGDDFSVNLTHYMESQKYNTCLNRKVSIDTCGEIKNCPSLPFSFGNIKDTTIEDAINHKDFRKYWNITKDHIKVCKNCEFRYICTDCRVYLEEPKDIYSKPLKCGYNPENNEWEVWNTNPLKQKVIKYYSNNLWKKD